jgi:hypothetical protein
MIVTPEANGKANGGRICSAVIPAQAGITPHFPSETKQQMKTRLLHLLCSAVCQKWINP